MSRDPARFATTDGKPAHPEYSGAESPAPQPVDPATGQHRAYWVLSDAERAKGFVRPVRNSYQHVGIRPTHPLRDLTLEEAQRYKSVGYIKFEEYPASDRSCVGRYWTDAQLKSGCGTVTRMGVKLAETYAREPGFYGSTFCVGCGTHFPVSEFRWIDEHGKLTDAILGS